MTAIESLAGGCPVVATRVGGVPDVVEEGVDGFLVEPGDLGRSPTGSGASPPIRSSAARMGAAGRERVLPRYAVERLIDDVDGLYRSLLRRKGVAVTSAPARTPQTTASEPAIAASSARTASRRGSGSSWSRNQSIMSMRGFLRAIANACVR